MSLAERTVGLVRVALPALTVVLGMQVLRALLPLLVFVLRDRLGWTAVHIGIYAVVLFALTFFAAPLWRLAGVRNSLLLTAGALGILRLGMQLWWGDPLVVLGLATAAALAFILFLPTYLVAERPGGPAATGRYGVAVLLGFAADAALHGALSTWDLVWHRQPWAIAVAAVLVGSQLILLGLRFRDEPAFDSPAGGSAAAAGGPAAAGSAAVAGAVSLPWLAIGPVLAATLLVFDNIARTAALCGWRLSGAFAAVMVAQVAGVVAATFAITPHALRRMRRFPSGTALILGLVLIGATAVTPSSRLLTFLALLLGQVALAMLFVLALSGLGTAADHATRSRLSAAGGVGMLVFVATLFLTYVGYDIALPLPSEVPAPIASGILAVCAIPSFRVLARSRGEAGPIRRGRDWRPALAAVALLVVPALVLATDRPAMTEPPTATLRIMTYNLHNGFGTDGWLDLEALARTIEEQHPDVVALQEVARGWVVDGSTDMLAWLSQRLDMGACVYGATAGPLWGNAILSRYPIAAAEAHALPPQDLLLQRGYIRARVETAGDGGSVEVFATHYHHTDDGSAIRVEQSQALLEAWRGASRTIFMGDLNGEPGAPEIELLRKAGLTDVVDAAGISPGYTYKSDDLYKRIDYIWVTPDLATTDGSAKGGVRDVVIASGTASDHLGISATIER